MKVLWTRKSWTLVSVSIVFIQNDLWTQISSDFVEPTTHHESTSPNVCLLALVQSLRVRLPWKLPWPLSPSPGLAYQRHLCADRRNTSFQLGRHHPPSVVLSQTAQSYKEPGGRRILTSTAQMTWQCGGCGMGQHRHSLSDKGGSRRQHSDWWQTGKWWWGKCWGSLRRRTGGEHALQYSVRVTVNGEIFVSDYDNHTICLITEQGVVRTICGNGQTCGLALDTSTT